MIYVTKSSMLKNEVRGTLAVSYSFGTYERLLMMFFSSNSPINFLTYQTLYSFIGIVITCLIGRLIGEIIGKYVNESIFRRIIMGILIFGSTIMMTSGISIEYQLITYFIITLFYCLIGGFVYYTTISNISFSFSSLRRSIRQLSSHRYERDEMNQLENRNNQWNYFHNIVNRFNSYEYFHERF